MREAHKKNQTHLSVLKEIRIRPETDPHDLGIKINHAREFIEKGHKVQFTVFFKGRQMLHQDKGYEMLGEIGKALEDIAKIENQGRMANRRLTLMIVPK